MNTNIWTSVLYLYMSGLIFQKILAFLSLFHNLYKSLKLVILSDAFKFASKYNVLYNSVTSDPTDLQSMAVSIRKDIITTSESTDHSFSHVITIPDIKSAVNKLRAGKSGGVSAVTSDCFIRGSDSLYAFIAMLFLGYVIKRDTSK